MGSLSWIHQQVTPIWPLLADGKVLSPSWVPQTYIGLLGTKNRVPGSGVDLQAYEGSKQFRALTFADLSIETSDDLRQILDVKMLKGILNPGWTPPFDRTISVLTRVYVPDPSMADLDYHSGELGGGSAIMLRKRHPNSTIGISVPDAQIVANALILFRAGPVTDNIGVSVVKCPYHVPWVWCEWLLINDGGKFTAFGTGSVFPTHTFFARGQSYGQQDEPTDARFMRSWRHPLTIDTSTLRVYPVLTTGAPATGSQIVDTTSGFAGPVSSIPYTVPSSGIISQTQL
jgi:hypothetical protein